MIYVFNVYSGPRYIVRFAEGKTREMARCGWQMRRVMVGSLLRALAVLAAVLVIASGLQWMVWYRGPDFVEIMLENMSFSGPDGYRLTKIALYRELGLDRPFIPDLWPFDNESLWHKSRPDSG